MNDKENYAWSKFAQRDIPFLLLIMDNIPHCQGIQILKYKLGCLEINSMLRKIFLALFLVILILHRVNRQ